MTTAKNILYCESNTDGTIGGSFYSLFFLLEGLDKSQYRPIAAFYREHSLTGRYKGAGIDVRILTLPKPIHIPFLRNPILGSALNPLFRLAQKAINFIRFFVIEAIRKAIFLKRERIKLIHLNNSIIRNHDWMLAALLTRTPFITHERGINRDYSRLAKFFGKKINAIICISNAVSDTLRDAGIPSRKLVTIYNGIDPERIKPIRESATIRMRHEILPKQPVIGIVGNIKEWKGQATVVKAVYLVQKHFNDVACLFVGDTAAQDSYYLKELEELVETGNIRSNIIFTGYQDNVADYLNIMDVVIHASVAPEPFGRVLIEAMAMRKPIVGSHGGAVPEIIQEGVTGMTFTPGDETELAKEIIYLLENPDIAKEMGENGYRRLVHMFHIDKNTGKTQELYERILG